MNLKPFFFCALFMSQQIACELFVTMEINKNSGDSNYTLKITGENPGIFKEKQTSGLQVIVGTFINERDKTFTFDSSKISSDYSTAINSIHRQNAKNFVQSNKRFYQMKDLRDGSIITPEVQNSISNAINNLDEKIRNIYINSRPGNINVNEQLDLHQNTLSNMAYRNIYAAVEQFVNEIGAHATPLVSQFRKWRYRALTLTALAAGMYTIHSYWDDLPSAATIGGNVGIGTQSILEHLSAGFQKSVAGASWAASTASWAFGGPTSYIFKTGKGVVQKGAQWTSEALKDAPKGPE